MHSQPSLPPLPCYLNGEYTLLPDAKISVMDRGFIFGDGVYEVVPVYGGQPFRFAQHMARLDRSLRTTRITQPYSHAQWLEIALKLIANYAQSVSAKTADINQLIYIQVTRGVALRDHAMPSNITPTVFVMSNAMKLPTPEQRVHGVACVTAQDFRWEKADIKSTSLLGAVFARQISVDAGALETVMFRGDYLSEAASSNVWVVQGGKVIGPPKDNLVLEGVRFGLLEEICRAQNIPFELRPVLKSEVLQADELLLSSATKEVLPITTLDGQPVGQGLTQGIPGPIYQTLYSGYQQAIAAAKLTSAVPASESLIVYPSQFPIKVMGNRVDGLVHAITQIAKAFDPAFDASTVELRESRGGKYLGVTITITATSREQLDELYRTLSTHPMVKVVL